MEQRSIVGKSTKKPVTEKAFLDREELARYLGLTVGFIDTAVSERRIPFVRLGHRTVRFKKADIDEWIADKAFRPGGDDNG